MTYGDSGRHLPILHDGRFYAWKRVADDYLSFSKCQKTGTRVAYYPLEEFYKEHEQVSDKTWLQQQTGYIVGTPRWSVDASDRLCGSGFHVGRPEYVTSFHGGQGKLLLTLICPSQVIAVADDCSSEHKLRVHHLECREAQTEEDLQRVLNGYQPAELVVQSNSGVPAQSWRRSIRVAYG